MKKILKGKKISVLGMGLSGVSAANLAYALGAKVFVSDSRSGQNRKELNKNILFEAKGHTDKVLNSDIVIKSPGLRADLSIIKEVKNKKIPLKSEIDFALSFIKPKKVVAITGTNGKTTTTALTGEIFKKCAGKTIIAGNIGKPLSSVINNVNSKTNLVLELSSYQLQDSLSIHPDICAILNITPDHAEHHGNMRNYILAKSNIFLNQKPKGYCILNFEDKHCRLLSKKCISKVVFFSSKRVLKEGVWFADDFIHVKIGKVNFSFKSELKIPGLHNIENAMAAVAIAICSGLNPLAVAKVVKNFKGVEHRIEFVKRVNGVDYVNDSKGTNVDSTRVALEAYNRPIWLILGGRDKGAPYKPIFSLVKQKVKGILLIGEASSIIKKAFAGVVQTIDCKTLGNAITYANKHAINNDVVLLSPACASFDQFKNFEHRGQIFKNLVNKLH